MGGAGGDIWQADVSQAASAQVARRPHEVLLELAERVLGWMTEIPAAILVVAAIIILLMGVIARFVFDRPLVWSDEVASLLFLWLAMLGAAIALRRGVHMRLTTVVSRMPAHWRSRANSLAICIPLIFLALLMSPALDYVDDQSFIETPALSWPDGCLGPALGLAGRRRGWRGGCGCSRGRCCGCCSRAGARRCW